VIAAARLPTFAGHKLRSFLPLRFFAAGVHGGLGRPFYFILSRVGRPKYYIYFTTVYPAFIRLYTPPPFHRVGPHTHTRHTLRHAFCPGFCHTSTLLRAVEYYTATLPPPARAVSVAPTLSRLRLLVHAQHGVAHTFAFTGLVTGSHALPFVAALHTLPHTHTTFTFIYIAFPFCPTRLVGLPLFRLLVYYLPTRGYIVPLRVCYWLYVILRFTLPHLRTLPTHDEGLLHDIPDVVVTLVSSCSCLYLYCYCQYVVTHPTVITTLSS